MQNTQVRLINRPLGLPKATDFSVETQPLQPLGINEIRVQNRYVSIDPAMRSWMAGGRSYINPVPVGAVMRALGTGMVVESRHPDYKTGDYLYTNLGIQEYALLTEEHLTKPDYGNKPYRVDPAGAPLPAYLGALGLPGMTAYFGLLRVGQIRAGETVLISAAAGGVGSLAGQIAKRQGCFVVGITSSPEKCRIVEKEFGFDACLSYKSPTWRDELAALCPDGVHVFFDNVGGDVLNGALPLMARGGRVILSGAVSQYNNMQFMRGPANYLTLISTRARMEGFVGIDFYDEFAEARAEIAGWIREGTIRSDVHLVSGPVDTFVTLLGQLFGGQNTGKLVLEIVAD
ncbi:NADP-dependent oxidoreductase [Spirosoma endbachense]|uniref:Zinc-binding dehydrogenase n=1 Tax=Spirosoma endbachense TaxID=2666025 RepID=A0A6P1VUA6_9BACT|nr:NADP-dependent oxidoreductase [Spirosoma endbachense]QHV96204.1 zinc-binding dehydrogenase [Spirosoma endbachense]